MLGAPQGYSATVPAYVPLTVNDNETVAAYIYFDGRPKEEVATLLRCGVETWVNSRWVSVPEAEGGGLAEREFLFREVGLERWLNGLDLAGQNKEKAEARIQRRKERLEKRRRKQSILSQDSSDEDNEGSSKRRARPVERNGILRYGDNRENPIEALPGDNFLSSDEDSDDVPELEASGQIKIALFRVLASGEVKKGEYSPQFDAHEGDDGMGDQNGGDGDATVEHSTGLAQPKTLDPKSISTQTVTGIDPPDKPYAVFTFMYRGESKYCKLDCCYKRTTQLISRQNNCARWASSHHCRLNKQQNQPRMLERPLANLTLANFSHSNRLKAPSASQAIEIRKRPPQLSTSMAPLPRSRILTIWKVTMTPILAARERSLL